MPTPPEVTDGDAPLLVALFHEPHGRGAALLLIRSPNALAAGMPLIIKRFRESLTIKVPDIVGGNLYRTSPASRRYRASRTRSACLHVFEDPGAEAKEVVPDLLALLRRKTIDDEYSGSKGSLRGAIVVQLGTQVQPLIEALKHEDPHVTYDVLTIMSGMSDSGKALGPAVSAEISHAGDYVAQHAVRALDMLGMEDDLSVERLRARIPKVRVPSVRSYMKERLAHWEKWITARRRSKARQLER